MSAAERLILTGRDAEGTAHYEFVEADQAAHAEKMQGLGALVVSRKRGQSILIGADIAVIVCGVDGAQVRLKIVARRDLPVIRSELMMSPHARACLASGRPV